MKRKISCSRWGQKLGACVNWVLGTANAPIVELDTPEVGVHIHICFGDDHPPRLGHYGAMLTNAHGFEEATQIVGYCARRGLPVDAWVISGLSSAPMRVGTLSRWLALTSKAAGPARVVIQTRDLSPLVVDRLVRELKRQGCLVYS